MEAPGASAPRAATLKTPRTSAKVRLRLRKRLPSALSALLSKLQDRCRSWQGQTLWLAPATTTGLPLVGWLGQGVWRLQGRLTSSCCLQEAKGAAKAGKKAVPQSFVEVVDCLVDMVARYRPPEPEASAAPSAEPSAEAAAGQPADAAAAGTSAGPDAGELALVACDLA